MAPSRLEPSVPLWNPAQAVSTPRLAQALEKEPLLSPVCIGSETQQLPTGAGSGCAQPWNWNCSRGLELRQCRLLLQRQNSQKQRFSGCFTLGLKSKAVSGDSVGRGTQ